MGVAAVILLVVAAVGLPVAAGRPDEHVPLLLLSLPMVGAFLWILRTLFFNRLDVPADKAFIAGAAFLLVAVISGLRSDCPQAALTSVLTWIGYGAGLLVAVWAGARPRTNRMLVAAVCALGVAIAVLGILQYVFLLDLTRKQIEADPQAALAKLGLSQRDLPFLKQRTITKRVFGTFALPNTMAGLLVLLIPASVGLAAGARSLWARRTLIAGTGVMVIGLLLTGSKGGWLAAAGVAGLFILLRGWRWVRGHARIALLALAGVVVVSALALGMSRGLRQRFMAMPKEIGPSARARAGYWSAALDMWKSRPLLGVGPGNFTNHYVRHASVLAEETQHAHNDYLEILAELGPLGVAAYLLFWATAVHRGWRAHSARVDASSWEPPPGLAAITGALTIFCLSIWLRVFALDTHSGHEILMTIGFLAFWVPFHLAGVDPPRPGTNPSSRLHTGLALGLVGFLLHGLVDLDLSVPGVGFLAFLFAGLLLAPVARIRRVELSDRTRLLAVVTTGVVGLSVFFVVVAVALGAKYRSDAVLLRRAAALRDRQYRELRDTDPLRADEQAIRAQQLLKESGELIEAAVETNPLDHQAYAQLARWLTDEIARSQRNPADAIEAWRRAIHLNPSFPDYRARFVGLLLYLARQQPSVLVDRLDRYFALARSYRAPEPGKKVYLPAIVQAYSLVDLAPNKPRYWMLYGEVLLAADLHREARARFKRAMELHRQLVEGGGPKRQLLDETELKHLRSRLSQDPGSS
jgi:putative inorganic carbon (HCO3(-)) transporter